MMVTNKTSLYGTEKIFIIPLHIGLNTADPVLSGMIQVDFHTTRIYRQVVCLQPLIDGEKLSWWRH